MAGEGDETQWFSPTSGRFSGWLGLGTGVVVAVVAVGSGSLAWVAAGLLIALAVWLILLRPRVGLRGRTLLLRGIVSTVEVPLSRVTGLAVRQVFVAWVGEKRYVNASLGRPMRDLRTKRGEAPRPDQYTDHILELLRSHQDDAKRWGGDGDAVRRLWAVPELVALGVLVVVTVVLALL
ncbi:hypothetical protein [Nocardioides sp. Kera G14]|uniref:hypothetical protein n=1 Tax=Nocardioides sp. Kera G14 TaxID=2884264 RepID=UPI001D115AE3|nr:hypothetical protein [Nocardioides sp. Kera G14]UDY24420.1 hypothetical protein LH076_03705 [Nocardioides sp. Kera G14]